jgi:hypothetical protein
MHKYVPVPGSSWQQFLNPKIPGESKTQNTPSPKFPVEEKKIRGNGIPILSSH